MRKITQDAVRAFLAGEEFSRDNTRVEIRRFKQAPVNSVILLLHNNPIARYVQNLGVSSLQVCDGGWQTSTTKERLNGLPGVQVHQKAGQWYLNAMKWEGGWTYVGGVMIVKHLGDDRYRVEYPHSAGREPIEFPTHKAARVFAEVEASNHGYKLLAE